MSGCALHFKISDSDDFWWWLNMGVVRMLSMNFWDNVMAKKCKFFGKWLEEMYMNAPHTKTGINLCCTDKIWRWYARVTTYLGNRCAQHQNLPLFFWGAFMYIVLSCYLKELDFFTIPLSQKFVLSTLKILIFNLYQEFTKSYIWTWGAHLLINAVSTHQKSSF